MNSLRPSAHLFAGRLASWLLLLIATNVARSAPPSALASPSLAALYQGSFAFDPRLVGVHPRLFTTAASLEAAHRHFQAKPADFAPFLPSAGSPAMALRSAPLAGDAGTNALRDLAWVASAYRVTQDTSYLNQITRNLAPLRTFVPLDIPAIGSTNNDLSAGEYLLSLATCYDLLKGVADPALTDVIRSALIAQGRHAYRSLTSLTRFPYEQNHFTIPVCGLGVAALALADELPEAKDWGLYSRNVMNRALDTVAQDGWFFEGMSYWSYTMRFPVLFSVALKAGTGENWFHRPIFQLAPLYLAHNFLPNPNFVFDFGDCGPRVEPGGVNAQKGYELPWHTAPLRIMRALPLAFWRETGDPEAERIFRRLAPLDPSSTGYLDNSLFLLWIDSIPPAAANPAPATPPYHYFDDMEVIHWRGSWVDPQATALAFKSGPPDGHAINRLLPLYPEWRPSLSHAHPDAGSLILYSRGAYLIGDTGYARKETAWHSSLLVDGAGQGVDGSIWSNFGDKPYSEYNRIHLEKTWLSAEVTAGTAVFQDAYPRAFGLRQVRRNLILVEGRYLVIDDTITSGPPHEFQWRLQGDADFVPASPSRFIEQNGAARLVVEVLSPFTRSRVGPTLVETELYSTTHSRLQQRGFHLELASARGKEAHFLAALCIQSSTESARGFVARKTGETTIEMSDGSTNCSIWIGPSSALQGDWAYVIRNQQGEIQSVGLSGRHLATGSFELESSGGNVTLRKSGGHWSRTDSVDGPVPRLTLHGQPQKIGG